MKGADMFVLLKDDSSGVWRLTDRHATGFVFPLLDQHNDLVLLSSDVQAASGIITAVLRRKLAPCDPDDLPIEPGASYHVLWAYGSVWDYHGPTNRGSKNIVFVPDPFAGNPTAGGSDGSLPSTISSTSTTPPSATTAPASAPSLSQPAPSASSSTADPPLVSQAAGPDASQVATYNLTMSAVKIPTDLTTYYVQFFKLPDDRKYHIIQYRAVVNSPLMHHVVVYGCSAKAAADIMTWNSTGPFDEKDLEVPCLQFYMFASLGNTPVVMPPEAGLPFGGGTYSWLALEIHYNNPEGLDGQSDVGSGITFDYTTQLRPNDMGLLTMHQFNLYIPRGNSSYTADTVICPGACTKRFRQPVHMVSQRYHMHGTGKSALTRRIRGANELHPIGNLRAFDYGFQYAEPIMPNVSMLYPGDTLLFTCSFDSSSRQYDTIFGLGSDDEMCVHYIYYWPRQADMGMCLDVPLQKDLRKIPGNPHFTTDIALCAPDIAPVEALFRNEADKIANYTAMGYLVPYDALPANILPYNATCTNELSTAASLSTAD
eukprot:jgi/Chrzof1/12496/Cz06g36120.t1